MLLHKITLALVWTNRLLQLYGGEMIGSWIGVVAVEWVRSVVYFGIKCSRVREVEESRMSQAFGLSNRVGRLSLIHI